MNKNSLIAFGLVGIAGIILYQVLFNFILPIALFVVLLYILKLLIKGFDQTENKTTSDVLKENILDIGTIPVAIVFCVYIFLNPVINFAQQTSHQIQAKSIIGRYGRSRSFRL